MNLANEILKAQKISNIKDIKKGIKNAIWRNEDNKVLCGEINICEHCKTPYFVNAINVLSGPVSLFKGLEKISIEECTSDPDNDYKCAFCS
jgi:hypothetical protein